MKSQPTLFELLFLPGKNNKINICTYSEWLGNSLANSFTYAKSFCWRPFQRVLAQGVQAICNWWCIWGESCDFALKIRVYVLRRAFCDWVICRMHVQLSCEHGCDPLVFSQRECFVHSCFCKVLLWSFEAWIWLTICHKGKFKSPIKIY